MATTLFKTSNIIRNFKSSTSKRKDKPRTIYKYWEMNNEDWDNYKTSLENSIKQDTALLFHLDNDNKSQGTLDLIWDKLSSHIKDAANETIPNSPSVDRSPRRPSKIADLVPIGFTKDIRTLVDIISQVRNINNVPLLPQELSAFNVDLEDIDRRYDTHIPRLPHFPVNEWITVARRQLRFINKLAHLEELKLRDIAIKKRLITRAEDTITNQSRMLSSVLNKDFRKITVDRLVIIENGRPHLYTDAKDILRLHHHNSLL